MGIYLNPGNEGFATAVRSKIYVDKTRLIAYTNEVFGTEQKYICVSRPRRFGKSMAANMLCAYYSKECDSQTLFSGLNIECDKSYHTFLNKYDVLFLNIQQLLSSAEDSERLVSYIQKTVLEELRLIYGDMISMQETRLPSALASVYARSKQGFVIIIDEWDCVFRELKEKGEVQKEYLDFLKDLFKDRTYVKLAYMTGILPIKKYGTHSALNVFYEYSMTDPKRLAEFVGFTEDEVKQLCEQYHMDFDEAKRWYDGYCFRRMKHIYNPKSVVDAMLEDTFHSYWTSTETYEALKLYIDMNFDGLKDSVTAMMGGNECRINPRKFQNDMTNFESKDDVLTLLIHLGYLAYNEEKQSVFIPNREIVGEFESAVEGTRGWEHLSEAIRNSEDLLKATLAMDAATVSKGIDAVHMEHSSVLSYNNENSLSCVVTLAYFSAQKEYTFIRELPTGKGFADIVFLPRRFSDKPAMIVELKWDKSADGAISQAKSRQYSKALEEYAGNLLLVGINYDKKTKLHQCVIEKVVK